MNRVELDERLAYLGIFQTEAREAFANYAPTVIAGEFLFISGQVAFIDGSPFAPGKVGREVSLEQAKEAARLCALAVVAQIRSRLSHELKLVQVCSIQGFVHAGSEFTEHAQVLNGASDFLVEVFGDKGRHSRTAVGVASLPFRCPVELSAVIQIC
ncbi:Endoribonuclease L-PSP [Yersinia enterocolitica]|uniref:RidA family protein n=1 Tax=Yersinia enterocolitica TaxID=630 RepID=UPI0005DC952C|nr:RidA family protein [Yersinia enterocolitica]CNG75720.1 Endoribonuclease L-PSP [Yersinia enterocolitica]